MKHGDAVYGNRNKLHIINSLTFWRGAFLLRHISLTEVEEESICLHFHVNDSIADNNNIIMYNQAFPYVFSCVEMVLPSGIISRICPFQIS